MGRVFARGPEAVADEIAARMPESAEPGTPLGQLRSLLLNRARLLVRPWDREELACTLYEVVRHRPAVLEWLTGVERALPPVRLALRGPDPAPDDPRLVRVLTGHRAPVCAVTWSPDGERLATVGAYDASVRIWHRDGWREEYRIDIEGAALDDGQWSPDGRWLAVLGKSNRFPDIGEQHPDDIHGWESHIEYVSMVLVFDTGTWQEVAATPTAPRFWLAEGPVFSWSPDSRTIAIGENSSVRLWEFEASGESPRLGPMPGEESVLDVRWRSDGALEAEIWTKIPAPEGHHGSAFERARVTWPDPLSAPESWTQGEAAEPGYRHQLRRTKAVAWSPDGSRRAVLRSLHRGWSDLVLWDTREADEPTEFARIDIAPEETTALAWSPGGDLLATGGESGVRLWRPEAGESEPHGFDLSVRRPVWSPDGTQVAVHAWEGNNEWFVFDPRDPANPTAVGEECPFPRRDPEEERERISEARMEGRGFDKYTSYYGHYAPDAVSPDGELYATTGGRAIFLLDLGKGRNRKMAEDERWARWAELAFSPEQDRLVSVQHGSATVEGSDDRVKEVVLTVWEVSTGRKLAREYLREDPAEKGRLNDFPMGLAVSRTRLAWCGRHGTLALHDLKTLRPLSRTRLAEEAQSVEFSPDGSTLVAMGHYGVRIATVVGADT
ncbi:hypothetical protein GCM10009603_28200 [Nocardiopsis exhalans]